MNIQVTFNPEEMLRNIDRKVVLNYIKDAITDDEKESIRDSVYSANSETLWEALELKVEQEHTEYYISENIEELMKQIRGAGCIDEITELFEMKYTG